MSTCINQTSLLQTLKVRAAKNSVGENPQAFRRMKLARKLGAETRANRRATFCLLTNVWPSNPGHASSHWYPGLLSRLSLLWTSTSGDRWPHAHAHC